MNAERQAFIEALCIEFVARTGKGPYVHLDPVEINRLFLRYLGQRLEMKKYIKNIVRRVAK